MANPTNPPQRRPQSPLPQGQEKRPQEGKEEHPARARDRAGVLQQHDRLDHRPAGQRPGLVVGRAHRLQGLAQGHAVRGAARRRQRRADRAGARRALARRQGDGPGAGRESAIRALAAAGIDIRSIKDVTPIPHNGCRRAAPAVSLTADPPFSRCRRARRQPARGRSLTNRSPGRTDWPGRRTQSDGDADLPWLVIANPSAGCAGAKQ